LPQVQSSAPERPSILPIGWAIAPQANTGGESEIL
jgi:hypothetical protein